MAGLLYKDYIGIRGTRIVCILLVCTFLFLILRFTFPGNVDTVMPDGMQELESGELVSITVGEFHDSFLIMPPLLLIACGIVLPSTWTAAICRNDEKHKTRQFTGALPLNKNAYFASKYIFIGIAVYVLFSLETTWIIIYNSVAGDNRIGDVVTAVSTLLNAVCGISLLLTSIELPFYLTLGVKKGNLLKTAVMEGIAFLAVAYLFFGNLKVFENFNIYLFAQWCEEHLVIVTLISILLPAAYIFLFWLSYRLTCRINQNREVEIYE